MKLRDLIKKLPQARIVGDDACSIQGICVHSKEVKKGDLFLARKGKMFNAEHFIPEAIERGISALAVEHYLSEFSHIPQIVHPSISQIEGEIADSFYASPSKEMTLIALTGTSGKTTTSFLVKQLMEKVFDISCGLIGTIETIIGNQRIPAHHTTPDAVTNHRILRAMKNENCQAVVMEVTSHALIQKRHDKIDFDVALFANLSHDHLDYHETVENYATAKKSLFDGLGKEKDGKLKKGLVNKDDPWAEYMLRDCAASPFSYGIEQTADLHGSDIRFSDKGSEFKVSYCGKSFTCHIPLVGKFNIYNCLAAMSVVLTQGAPLEQIVSHLPFLQPVRGRLEQVPNQKGLSIFVDFAHKPDALLNVLVTLRDWMQHRGKLIVVFGCGGDRDRSKRPKMAEICERFADFTIVTSDNPRSEDPLSICQEIEKGFSHRSSYDIVLDRREAIQRAVDDAKSSDVILVAGKGHETGQIFSDCTKPFDDREVVIDICGSAL